MRVIAGEKGGRRLLAPPGRSTRPTSDRTREAAFSMLASLGVLEEATVWDLFAGSGAMGIEALSRGAARATFVDHARPAVAVARANLAQLGYGPARAVVVCADVPAWVAAQAPSVPAAPAPAQPSAAQAPSVPAAPAPAQPSAAQAPSVPAAPAPAGLRAAGAAPDLVLADPPYAWDGWATLLEALAPHHPLVLMEAGRLPDLPAGWDVIRSKRYGGTVVTLTRRALEMDL